LLWHIHRKK